MFTIRQAAKITGVAEATLRTWERRYGVVTPKRTDSGYRIYDNEALAALTAMRKLVDAGWSPAEASKALREGTVSTTSPPAVTDPAQVLRTAEANAETYLDDFLGGARNIDTRRIEASLDRGFSTGSFEHVVDTWLCPALVSLGDLWRAGEIDVAGEHAASHTVFRRLSAAFQAAAASSRGPTVVVGLPPGSTHELGALAFATALRRRGLDVVYLGADVPVTSWDAAVRARGADAAVMGVVTAGDRPSASATARALLTRHEGLLVAAGGAFAAELEPGVRSLPAPIGAAAEHMDLLLHGEARD